MYKWLDVFKLEWTSIHMDQHSSHPRQNVPDEMVGHTKAVVCENICISLDVMAGKLDAGVWYAHIIVMGFDRTIHAGSHVDVI